MRTYCKIFFYLIRILPVTIFALDIVALAFIEVYYRYQNVNKVHFIFEERENIDFLPENGENVVYKKAKVHQEKSNLDISDYSKEDANQNVDVLVSDQSEAYKKTRLDLVEIKDSGRKYVLYDNYLIDIGEFMLYHPGGHIHISESLYMDISRFVTGTVSLNGRWMPHDHSFSAVNFIHTRIFGVLSEDHRIMLDNNQKSCYHHGFYEMTGRKVIAKSTFELSFSPLLNDKNVSYKFSKGLKGFTWIGKHFSVSSKSLNKTRFYSVCLTLDEDIQLLHKNLLDNFDNIDKLENNEITDLKTVKFNPNKTTNTLKLYVKRYNFNTALSNHLSNYKVNQSFDANLHFEGDLLINGPLVNYNINEYF